MNVVIGVPVESVVGECRVALDPAVVKSIADAGYPVHVEKNAGQKSFFYDSDYSCIEGVSIVSTSEVWKADLVVKIQPPTDKEVGLLKKGSILISFIFSHQRLPIIKKLCQKSTTILAMELLPRITRAQAMDTLSSQAAIAGYKAVIKAADLAPIFFPMLTYAAGTIRPARVLVIGVGVAGLQAIATAKRLGAQVSAYDVRPETKEQVESLGAKFIQVDVQADGDGGYARELTQEEKTMQQQMLAKHLSQSNVVITTAAVPGRQAPKIISKKMIAVMEPGSIIVDLAAESGGNTELTKAGKIVAIHGVRIAGLSSISSSMPQHASQMYSKNMYNVLLEIFDNGKLTINKSNEVIAGCLLTNLGKILHPTLKELKLQAKPAKTITKKIKKKSAPKATATVAVKKSAPKTSSTVVAKKSAPKTSSTVVAKKSAPKTSSTVVAKKSAPKTSSAVVAKKSAPKTSSTVVAKKAAPKTSSTVVAKKSAPKASSTVVAKKAAPKKVATTTAKKSVKKPASKK